MSDLTVTIEIDKAADVAYIRLSDQPVARTVELSEEILVDLDKFDVVVGLEVLRLGAEIPFGELTGRLHVHTDVIDVLRMIQPSVSGVLELTQSSEGSASMADVSTARSQVATSRVRGHLRRRSR